MTRRPLSVLALALVLVVVACRREPPPPPAPAGPTAAEIEAARQDSIARVTAQRDSVAAAEAARERAAQAERDRIHRDLLASLEAMVNFDYDESAITPRLKRYSGRRQTSCGPTPPYRLPSRDTPTSAAQPSTTSHWPVVGPMP